MQKETCWEELDEYHVVLAAQRGDVGAFEYLMRKYRYLVLSRASDYFLHGADREDLIQEGMIGLYRAIKGYKKEYPFRAFAGLCVQRQIYAAIRRNSRQKHRALNNAVSLNAPLWDDPDCTLLDVMPNRNAADPEELIIAAEEASAVARKIREKMTQLELQVLVLFCGGRSYQEIASALGKNNKSVDNALQRAKRKLKKVISVCDSSLHKPGAAKKVVAG